MQPPGAPMLDRGVLDLLRGDLAGYTVDAVTELLGEVAHGALAREQAVAAELVVTTGPAANEPLAALVAAFVLGLPVRRERLARALPRSGVDGAVRLGLCTSSGADPDAEVRALVDLRPYAAEDALGRCDWWITSDLTQQVTRAPLRPDHVLGIGGASTTLARCAVRRPVQRVLDLGTGCGVQALHATRHAHVVVATDVSPRALAFARFTLALNAVSERVDLRLGDLFDPVKGEGFDLVLSNPPFVITPRMPGVPRYDYRDAGRVGDQIVTQLITEAEEVLVPGGTAQFLANWEHRRGEPWEERVGSWLAGSGLDAWIVQREIQDPAEYAELWIRDAGAPDAETYDEFYRTWLADFARRDVEAVGFGLVILRRRSDRSPNAVRPPIRRLEDVRGLGTSPLGDHLARCLDAAEWLAGAADDDVLASRLRVAPDVTEERYHRPGEADPEVVLLRQGGGFGRVVRADAALAGFVGACDGELTGGRIVHALSVLLDRPVTHVAADLLPAVRALIADGLLDYE